MSRDVTQLHPVLQEKIAQLKELCKKNGISIGISECLRTVAEQDALYAKGRTTTGPKVTNAKGSSYQSMHQWGVAFDFYLTMDVDGDGKTSDDAYNNSTHLFEKVGKLGKSIGLEWGGDWKSICDTPHFQLPDWGSSSKILRETYKTPDKFMNTWKKPASKPAVVVESGKSPVSTTSTTTPSKSTSVVEAAKSKDTKYAGTYVTTANLNLRTGAGTGKSIVVTIPKGKTITCYGYYTAVNGTTWLFVAYDKYTGFVSSKYCNRK